MVAATITTSLSSKRPSISVRNWLTTLSVTWESDPLPRAGTMESISSKNTRAGAAWRALRKISLTALSDSPTHLLNSSGPLTLMKLTLLSVARALTRRVLPVPGRP